MSKSKTPISRREILIGGAATVAVAGLSLPAAAVNPSLQALLRRRNKSEERLT